MFISFAVSWSNTAPYQTNLELSLICASSLHGLLDEKDVDLELPLPLRLLDEEIVERQLPLSLLLRGEEVGDCELPNADPVSQNDDRDWQTAAGQGSLQEVVHLEYTADHLHHIANGEHRLQMVELLMAADSIHLHEAAVNPHGSRLEFQRHLGCCNYTGQCGCTTGRAGRGDCSSPTTTHSPGLSEKGSRIGCEVGHSRWYAAAL